MYEKLKEAKKAIRALNPLVPRVGLVLGSGLGPYVQHIQQQQVIPYSLIPHFKKTTVDGHEGKLILGKVNNVEVAILQGRSHCYEGHSLEEIVFPVRTLGSLGIQALILTNAAGGINKLYSPGDLVLIKDHINLMGLNPLCGINQAELGPRFPDMTYAYHPELKKQFEQTAKELNYTLRSGVYCSVLGPSYETPAEIRMLEILGSDMVGMSTVPESIAANHMGLKVVGISCITNMAAGIINKKLKHEDIKDVAEKTFHLFSALLNGTIEKIGKMLPEPEPKAKT